MNKKISKSKLKKMFGVDKKVCYNKTEIPTPNFEIELDDIKVDKKKLTEFIKQEQKWNRKKQWTKKQ